MRKCIKPAVLFVIGGAAYYLIEMLWRGHSHLSMFLLGGLCFLLIGGINNHYSWDLGFLWQCLIGAVIVTTLEFITGLVVNVRLGLDVWDYSNQPFNVMGQICLGFSLLWIPLSGVAVMLDDYLRYQLFGEDEPHYTIV